MSIVAIQPAGQFGIIKDVKPHELPPQAWSSGENMRFFDGYAIRMTGEQPVMGTPSVAPIWLLPYFTATDAWWIYAGTTAVYATDGASHYDISGATYAATLDNNWTGGMLNSLPILNNPINGPFYLPGPAPSTSNLTALPNWTYGTVTAMTCRGMRPFKNYLVAFDVTKTVGAVSTSYPQLVKWSHAADPGSLPISWDEADPRYDTGEYPLADTEGKVVDMLPLRDLNVVYKDDSTYLMQLVGGVYVFRFMRAFSTFGMLAPKCAANLPKGGHLVLSSDDVLVHNGTTAESVMDKRLRRNLFNRIDSTYYGRSFIADNDGARELWVCIPEDGASLPTLAYVWNWNENTWSIRDLNSPAFATSGVVSTGLNQIIDNDSGIIDNDPSLIDEKTYNPSMPYFVGAHPNTTQLRQYDATGAFAGTDYTAILERTGLGVPFDANLPPDIHSVKFLRGLWPRIEGTTTAFVNVEVGTQFDVGTDVVWQEARPFQIGSDVKIDCRASGRLLAVRFSAPGTTEWRVHGYDLDVVRGGTF